MTKNKNKSTKKIHQWNSEANSIPINAYITVVGVHTTLWAFTGLYIPRTTFIDGLTNTKWDFSQQLSSRDRPQHPFLVALTLNPTWTLASICVGAGIVQSWWAGQVRQWWLDLSIQGTEEEKRMEKALYDSKKLRVRVQRHKGLHPILKWLQ